MASWTLGKIFSVDEEKESTQDPSDSGSDSDEDEDVRERQAAFNKGKQNANAHSDSQRSSYRRYDEFGDFLSRSERAHRERLKDPEPKGKSGGSGEGHKSQKVRFPEDEKLFADVHEIPKMNDEDKERCFMTTENWVSIDNDIELTSKRWSNHMEGRIAFDEDNNTIRGIEVC